MDAGPSGTAAKPRYGAWFARLRRPFAYLRVGTKIAGVSLVVAAIFAGVGVIGLLSSRDLAAQQDHQYRVNVVALAHMTAIRAAIGTQQGAVLAHILSDRGFYQDNAAATIVHTDSTITLLLDKLSNVGLPALERSRLESFKAVLKLWRTARDTALQASALGERQRAASIVLVRSEAIARAVKDRADEFLAHLVDAVAAGAKSARESSENTGRLMMLLLASGTIVAVALSVLAARTISRPLREAVTVLSGVGRGDFSRRLNVKSHDEVGQMGRALNETLAALEDAFATMRHQAFHDGLTGLANRTLFRDRVAQAISSARRGLPVAVLLIDLDGFKQVNDDYGHAVGDALLTAVAQRLRDGVRGHDTASRLGGDEFAVVLDGLDSPDDAPTVAQRLLVAIQAPVVVGDREILPRASVGVARWQGHTGVDALLHDADVAMYAAKTAGKGQVVTFDPRRRVDAERVRARSAQHGTATPIRP
ncbi:diguanylate cyclase domain-containing protein [Couchioplanes caeruleus]|uniref:Diguanylate cyclase (GGDEF)-like protein n=2 Tax=Couchioplanes caeruleus TaxID=56438 RepID=A0A1K0FJJ5_9ACTN|nr:diguanylate cyclase [Couchioplanes caeruleus]OJF13001.1 hypothetical protein BG844_17675 [Couchioplanes caeruleus subsp. caeruleus]